MNRCTTTISTVPTATPRRPRAARRGGLTLVELAVALVVLGLIAVVAVPRLGRANAAEPRASVRGDLAVLRNAIELYAADHRGAYPTLANFEAALTRSAGGQGPYLQAIPGPRAQAAAAAATSPRVAAFPVPGTAATGPGPAAWFYDEQTGRIQAHVASTR